MVTLASARFTCIFSGSDPRFSVCTKARASFHCMRIKSANLEKFGKSSSSSKF